MKQRLRFPKARRLTREAEFKRIREQGQTIRGALITLAILRNGDAVAARAGFITSRRVGHAVLRNRTRRRLREIFRKHQHQLTSGTWIITIASARAARVPFARLEEEWLRLAERASILAA